ncbi:cell wall hydrolase [Roseibium album]|uniref:Spore cortex-lytic enzyme n=1 Tax=Roseibium album TaxID=311410 RepID=A0A0M7ASY3_9HYPH|nr:cell wall hydrolase [Roseibium album]CTQ60003.1 spore cortex-lytic enzyme [Roseibium album]CTQ77035.1 spore cortex-lytic enzyme [Roseibium album]CTQ77370.1 spore cortex-lytic enzyme [Roseibium album]
MHFLTKAPPFGETIPVYQKNSRNSPLVRNLIGQEAVTLNPNMQESSEEWGFISIDQFAGGASPSEGWIEMKNIEKRDPADIARFPLPLRQFIRSCARAEFASTVAESDANSSIMADYLIAWANVESATAQEPFSNPEPDFAGSDAEGPFRLTSVDWKTYMNEVNDPHPYVSDFERLIPTCQVAGAAFKVLKDVLQFSELITPKPIPQDGVRVASYLNALHCHLIGVEAAVACQKHLDKNSVTASMEQILSGTHIDQAMRDNLIQNRKRFLLTGNKTVTLETFVKRTNESLAKAFKEAYRQILAHADYLLPPKTTVSGPATWMNVAADELQNWDDNSLVEHSGSGLQKVISYLASVGLVTNKYEHWCGGFVGYCLSNATPSFMGTLVQGGARASNWVNWGNASLRNYQLRDIPQGAIVVTRPLAPGTSGHVAFFEQKVPNEDAVFLFGGNQTNSITKNKKIHKNDIRDIRWLDVSDPATDAIDPTPVPGSPINATQGELLVLARTLYGEARNQSKMGIEAVAQVVLNRARKQFFGKTIREVCLHPKQFSCWNRNDPNFAKIKDAKPNSSTEFDLCFSVAQSAVAGTMTDHIGADTLHYHATYIAKPSWVVKSSNPVVTLREGSHIFYKNID